MYIYVHIYIYTYTHIHIVIYIYIYIYCFFVGRGGGWDSVGGVALRISASGMVGEFKV